MDTGKKIIEKARELFMQYGLKSISMDDVARTLGISKKTLYQCVNNKADLIKRGLVMHIEEEKLVLEEIHQSAKNAIDEMIKISKYVSQTLQKVNPSVIHELQKYYQSSWELMESLHVEHTYFLIKKNIEKGIEEGLYREDVHPDITAKLYIGRMDLVVDKSLFPIGEYTFSQIHNNMITYHLYGIMSKKGREIFEAYNVKPSSSLV
jgi:AcrR family transcriptional regulator